MRDTMQQKCKTNHLQSMYLQGKDLLYQPPGLRRKSTPQGKALASYLQMMVLHKSSLLRTDKHLLRSLLWQSCSLQCLSYKMWMHRPLRRSRQHMRSLCQLPVLRHICSQVDIVPVQYHPTTEGRSILLHTDLMLMSYYQVQDTSPC